VKFTATDLAHDSKSILDHVIRTGETVEVQRRGRTVAELRPATGVHRSELVHRFQNVKFTDSERRALRSAMDAAADVVGYAGRD
jgi:antitoxin (DNA-binding transcriptional repressor) of toxin-antitoxin stability system